MCLRRAATGPGWLQEAPAPHRAPEAPHGRHLRALTTAAGGCGKWPRLTEPGNHQGTQQSPVLGKVLGKWGFSLCTQCFRRDRHPGELTSEKVRTKKIPAPLGQGWFEAMAPEGGYAGRLCHCPAPLRGRSHLWRSKGGWCAAGLGSFGDLGPFREGEIASQGLWKGERPSSAS